MWSVEDCTQGELVAVVEACQEARRRDWQQLAGLAYRQAVLINQTFAGGQLPPVYEVFPLWTEEETRQMQLERYRQIMQRYAAQGRRSG